MDSARRVSERQEGNGRPRQPVLPYLHLGKAKVSRSVFRSGEVLSSILPPTSTFSLAALPTPTHAHGLDGRLRPLLATNTITYVPVRKIPNAGTHTNLRGDSGVVEVDG